MSFSSQEILDEFEEASWSDVSKWRSHQVSPEAFGPILNELKRRRWLALTAELKSRRRKYVVKPCWVRTITCPRCGNSVVMKEGLSFPIHQVPCA